MSSGRRPARLHTSAPMRPAALAIVAATLASTSLAAPGCADDKSRERPTTARFLDNGDGTVTDTKSKLMWMRCSAGLTWAGSTCVGAASLQTWESAEAFAVHVNRQGVHFFNDWRLPSLSELATISERRCTAPRIDEATFPATPPALYWTASTRPGKGAEPFAFALSFGIDGIKYSDKLDANRVRLVRNAL